ncbi:MAG: hypothetical protein HYY62_08185 [Deltaproteobacteria bacterium]|nr:hypothetical protein [Deltaproteobacteria bacterium]
MQIMVSVIKKIALYSFLLALTACHTKSFPISIPLDGQLLHSEDSKPIANYTTTLQLKVTYKDNGAFSTEWVDLGEIRTDLEGSFKTSISTSFGVSKMAWEGFENITIADYELWMDLGGLMIRADLDSDFGGTKPSLENIERFANLYTVHFYISQMSIKVVNVINLANAASSDITQDTILANFVSENLTDPSFDVAHVITIAKKIGYGTSQDAVLKAYAKQNVKTLSQSELTQLAEAAAYGNVRDYILQLK